MYVCYPTKYREMIEKSFPRIMERCFDSWFYPPVLSTVDWCANDEESEHIFELHMNYKDPNIDAGDECIQRHLAMDNVQAFIEGMIYLVELNDALQHSDSKG